MKIIYINNLYPPYAVGGAEQVVFERAAEALGLGMSTAVITSVPWQGWGSWRPVRTVEGGIVIFRYWVPNLCWYRNLGRHNIVYRLLWHKINVWNWWSTKIVQKILKEEKPDVVETHNLTGIGYGIPRAIQKLGVKHVHYLHDIQLVEPSGVLPWNHRRDSLFQLMYRWIMKWRMGKPEVVVSPSRFLEKFYKDRKFFLQSKWELGIRNKESGIIGQRTTRVKKHFLFVGSLVEHKGLQILIEAWKSLPQDLDARLEIVGDGALRDEVEQFAKEDRRVTYHGRLEKKELKEVYRNNDFLIFPSICLENRPTVIVEALQYGLRVIASDTGGVDELVEDRINGWLIEPNNAEALKEIIENKISL